MNSKQIEIMNIARRIKREEREASLLEQAIDTVNSLDFDVNQSRILCAIMFWCEGETSTKSGVRFMNSDPNLMRLFVTLLRNGFDIDESKFRGLLHLHEYHDEGLQLKYWSEVTGIPINQFYKSYKKPHTGKRKREDYPGCLSLRYGDSGLAKLLTLMYSNLGKNLGA